MRHPPILVEAEIRRREASPRIVLVTGASGYLGRQVLAALWRRRVDVVMATSQSGVVGAACDLTDWVSVESLLGDFHPDRVIHCAARVPKAVEEYGDGRAARESVEMMRMLIGARCPIVFASSHTVEIRPGSAYARGKLLAEKVLFQRGDSADRVVRLPGLFGAPRRSGAWYREALGDPVQPKLWPAMSVRLAAEELVDVALEPTTSSVVRLTPKRGEGLGDLATWATYDDDAPPRLRMLADLVRDVGGRVLGCGRDGGLADAVAHLAFVTGLPAIESLPTVSEENLESQAVHRPDRYWLVDPLDGTASFREGFPGFVVQAALMYNGLPEIAAVHAPVDDKLYLAERSRGAAVNGRPCRVQDRALPVLTDNTPEPQGLALAAQQVLGGRYIESGSIGRKLCLIADGTANALVKDVPVRDWDVAPGQLILEEAGGRMKSLDDPWIYDGPYDKRGLIAASGPGVFENLKALTDGVPA